MLTGPSDEKRNLYRLAFVQNCFVLLVRAHGGLDTQSLKTAEEPHITGELVRSARALIESDNAEPWMEHLEILDDPPQTLAGHYGKKRPRIDIELVRTGHGLRPRFHIEAKRLYRSDSVNEYFGAGGLQMFLGGEYAGSWPSAGMLSYVQSDTGGIWLGRLAAGFASRHIELCVCEGYPHWIAAGWHAAELNLVHTSCHERIQNLGRIQIFHLLLDFT